MNILFLLTLGLFASAASLSDVVTSKGAKDNKALIKEFSRPGKVKEVIRYHYEKEAAIDDEFLDRILGIEYDKIENSIEKKKDYSKWTVIRWKKEITQTMYDEIRSAFKMVKLTEKDIFYDLGSGHGRVLFYGATIYPNTTFKGIEIVPERVKETEAIARTHSFKNVSFVVKDVREADFSDGTCFYLFNPFPDIMPTVLERLKALAKKRKITVITFHRPGEELLKEPWLKLTGETPKRRFVRVFESK